MKLRYILPLLFSTLLAGQTMVIAGQSNKVYSGLNLSSTTGDCLEITGSTNITIRNSKIGPCAGNGIKAINSAEIAVYDSHIHPQFKTLCCDKNDGIFANKVTGLQIKGNVVAYGGSNVEVYASTGVVVAGNFLLNPIGPFPRGQNFQCWNGCVNVTVQNNYAFSSTSPKYLYPEVQEDSINFGLTKGVLAQGNFITGGHSKSGCGLIADLHANSVRFLDNTLVDTGECGVAIADGTNQTVTGNRVLNRTPVPGAGNTALYVWQSYGAKGVCGPVEINNNIGVIYLPNGTKGGYWKGAGCDPTTLVGNTFGAAADKILSATPPKPPLIPPSPVSCVADSPYSQPRTGLQTCK